MAKKFNYYRSELESLNIKDSQYPASFKVTNDSKSTKNLGLNDESASELVKWLKENYNVTDLS